MKKYTAIILSIISLGISLTIALLWYIHPKEVPAVEMGSYIGTIVTTLAIIVTIVLGWQIYNVIDYKEKVAEIHNLKKDYESLKLGLADAQLDVEFVACQTSAQTFINQKFYGLTTIAFMKALLTRLQKTDIKIAIDDINWIFDELEKYTKPPFLRDSQMELKKYIEQWNNEIRSHKNYAFIKVRYETIYKELYDRQKWN